MSYIKYLGFIFMCIISMSCNSQKKNSAGVTNYKEKFINQMARTYHERDSADLQSVPTKRVTPVRPKQSFTCGKTK